MRLDAKTGLYAIAILAAAGVLFSGYLSYNELWGGAVACGAQPGAPAGAGLIFGLPACVYGLAMYVLVFAIAVLSLNSLQNK